jgi:hypothetical protein
VCAKILDQPCLVLTCFGQTEINNRQGDIVVTGGQGPARLVDRPCLNALLKVDALFEHNREHLTK